jgi:transposase-like protein
MQECGYAVDHSAVRRGAVHYAPRIEEALRKNKKWAGHRWRPDETYIKIKGDWKYLYRAERAQSRAISSSEKSRGRITGW